ncbi:MAG: PilN domain-containing protein [Bacillota bacterium]|nr:PilN domain-containing protein [Bacillota bacterium]
MKKLNLLPPELQQQQTVNIKRLMIRSLIGLILLVLLTVTGIAQAKLMSLENRLEELEAQRQLLYPMQDRKIQLEHQLAEVEEKLLEYKKVSPIALEVSLLLDQLEAVMPADSWLTKVGLTTVQLHKEVEEEAVEDTVDEAAEDAGIILKFTLEGYSKEVASVAKLSYLLNQMKVFNNVNIEYAREVEINGVKLIEFFISTTIAH